MKSTFYLGRIEIKPSDGTVKFSRNPDRGQLISELTLTLSLSENKKCQEKTKKKRSKESNLGARSDMCIMTIDGETSVNNFIREILRSHDC